MSAISQEYLDKVEKKYNEFMREARISKQSKDLHHLNALKYSLELRSLLQQFRGKS